MNKIKNKKLVSVILGVVAVLVVLVVINFSMESKTIRTEGFTMDGNSVYVKNIESEEDAKTISFEYSVKKDNEVDFKIYDPQGNLKDSWTLSKDAPYSKEFDNVEGEWKVELNSKSDDENLVESTITIK